jgi:hypothetical protein
MTNGLQTLTDVMAPLGRLPVPRSAPICVVRAMRAAALWSAHRSPSGDDLWQGLAAADAA